MSSQPIRILQLYPDDMNIYGDWGNTLALQRRLEWRGHAVELLAYNPGDEFPDNVDIIVGGGGQDSGQSKIEDDLRAIGPHLKELAESGTPMLVICGLYQLFGHSFTTKDGTTIEGIGLLDLTTIGGPERLIGNIITRSEEFGDIIGYENHSGLTTLGAGVTPLGRVIKGAGNNAGDGHEGARYKNVIGTYLHGSLLPKNPSIADFLIHAALQRRSDLELSALSALDDTVEINARNVAMDRPR